MAVLLRGDSIYCSSTSMLHEFYSLLPTKFCPSLLSSILYSSSWTLWKRWAWGTAWGVKRRFVIGADVNMALIQFLLRFKTVVITTRRLIISLFLWESGVEFEFHCKATPSLFIISSFTASSLLRSWHCHWPERALTYTQYVGAKGKKRSQTQLEPID